MSYAGTEDATMDVNADLGFASMNLVLAWQVAYAHAFATKAQQSLKGHHLSLTGHSLGGGLAQIIAARTSLPAVTFSAPEVTSVRGVEADYIRNKPKIVNFAIFRDPINATLLIGRRIGKTYVLPSNRTGIAAHSIDKTVEELMPQGQFSPLGMVDPFAT